MVVAILLAAVSLTAAIIIMSVLQLITDYLIQSCASFSTIYSKNAVKNVYSQCWWAYDMVCGHLWRHEYRASELESRQSTQLLFNRYDDQSTYRSLTKRLCCESNSL